MYPRCSGRHRSLEEDIFSQLIQAASATGTYPVDPFARRSRVICTALASIDWTLSRATGDLPSHFSLVYGAIAATRWTGAR